MSTTIDSLDIQITTSAGQAERKIQALAEAMGRLKENGKITQATNGLKKLAGALNELNPALNGLNAAKLQQLRAAVSGLANIQKLSGLNSAINTLKKLPEVISGLDTGNLDKLESQMKRLAQAIAPLATQIDKIGTGFAKLPAKVTQVVSATNKMATATQKATDATEKHNKALDAGGINIMSAIYNFNEIIGAVRLVGDAFHTTIADAMEWDGIQYRFGRAFGEDAEEVYEYVQKVNEVLGINIQQFMQYSSLYGSLLSGFGMAQEKVTTISVGLTELSYDIWAAYNDRFKTLEDASEAVRSAITGEIEPIRNAGIALTEASLQEYMNSVGMAHISIEKLSEAQKAEVRYAAMMNAAMQQGIVGTYAAEMQTAEGAVRNLSQAFKGLKQAFGSLFIPILQIAIPYLTAFVNILREAIAAIADFFGITFMEIDWGNTNSGVGDLSSGLNDAAAGAGGVASGLGDAAAAAKKIRDYTIGFDELNVIQPPTETGGSGGSGSGAGGGGGVDWGSGLDLETLWDESVFAKATKQVDELKQKIKDWFDEWKVQIGLVAGALSVLSIATLIGNLGEAIGLGDDFLGKVDKIKQLAATAIILTIQFSLQSEALEEFIETGKWEKYIESVIIGALGAFGSYATWKTKGLALSLGITAYVSISAALEDGEVDSTEEVVTGLTGVVSGIGALGLAWKAFGPGIKELFGNITSFFGAAGQMAPEVGWLAALFPKLSSAFASIGTAISSAWSSAVAFLGGISAPVWGIIALAIAAVVGVIVFLKRNWEEVTEAVKGFFETNIVPKLESIKESWENMKSAIRDALPEGVIKWFKDAAEWIGGVVKAVGEFFKSVDWLEAIGTVFEWLGGIVFSVVSGVIAAAFSTLVQIVQGVVKSFSGIVEFWTGFIEFWVALFTGGDLTEPLKQMWDGVVHVFTGLYDSTVGVVVNLVESIIDWFTELWDELVGHSIVPDMVEAIIEWFLSLPDKIFKSVQDFVDGIVEKFEGMWSDIKSWYKTNVAPKFTSTYWKGVFDKVKTGIRTKLEEVKSSISEKWGNVKSWFNTNVAPKLTLTYWKDKFESIRKGLATKLDEAWKEIKSFFSPTEWGKKVTDAMDAIKENFKLPSLPKIKLEVTYSTDVGKTKKLVYEALGLSGWPSLKWSTYAMGGFPSMGEMFIAREAGPEMVGTIGNRTAVVNNDQIVEAVSRGVYSAVVAAMSSSNGGNGQNVNVYLDGKQIYASVKRVEAERGVSVMGNQLGYAY